MAMHPGKTLWRLVGLAVLCAGCEQAVNAKRSDGTTSDRTIVVPPSSPSTAPAASELPAGATRGTLVSSGNESPGTARVSGDVSAYVRSGTLAPGKIPQLSIDRLLSVCDAASKGCGFESAAIDLGATPIQGTEYRIEVSDQVATVPSASFMKRYDVTIDVDESLAVDTMAILVKGDEAESTQIIPSDQLVIGPSRMPGKISVTFQLAGSANVAVGVWDKRRLDLGRLYVPAPGTLVTATVASFSRGSIAVAWPLQDAVRVRVAVDAGGTASSDTPCAARDASTRTQDYPIVALGATIDGLASGPHVVRLCAIDLLERVAPELTFLVTPVEDDAFPGDVLPISFANPKGVCAGVRWRTIAGLEQQGLLPCLANAVADCTRTGETGCRATAGFPAGGAAGTGPAEVPECDTDGEIGCVTSEEYRAAQMGAFTAQNISEGVAIAGVLGTSVAPASNPSTNPGPSPCSSDGAVGCVTTEAFKSAGTAIAVPANIRSGARIAGVDGAFSGPSVCGADGAKGCVTNDDFPAVAKSGFIAANVLKDVQVGGVAGTLDLSLLTAGNVRDGVTIAGVLGKYPSADFPLPNAGQGGISLALDGSFQSQVKSETGFEWWDRMGTRYTARGDADITEGNIAGGVTIFGEDGTLSGGPFPAESDVRYGVSYGTGDVGTMRPMKICRNARGITGFGGTRSVPYDGRITNVSTGTTVNIDGTTTVTANNTAFFGNVAVGDRLTVAGETRIITVIDGSTQVTVDTAFTQTLSNQAFVILPTTNADMTVDDYQNGGASVPTPAGTVTHTAGSKTLLGSGTAFTSEFSVGDILLFSSQAHTIASIVSDTELTTSRAITSTASNVAFSGSNRYPPGSNCDGSTFDDVTGGLNLVPDTTQMASWSRVYQDVLTGMYLTNVFFAFWSNAVDACANLNGGAHSGGTGWHLPTQKELLQLYVDGAVGLFPNTGHTLWASTFYTNPNQVLTLALNSGTMASSWRWGTSNPYVCVRE